MSTYSYSIDGRLPPGKSESFRSRWRRFFMNQLTTLSILLMVTLLVGIVLYPFQRAVQMPGEALSFVGDRYEARVTLGGEYRIVLFLPRARDWREGERLQLGFPPAMVSVWPA